MARKTQLRILMVRMQRLDRAWRCRRCLGCQMMLVMVHPSHQGGFHGSDSDGTDRVVSRTGATHIRCRYSVYHHGEAVAGFRGHGWVLERAAVDERKAWVRRWAGVRAWKDLEEGRWGIRQHHHAPSRPSEGTSACSHVSRWGVHAPERTCDRTCSFPANISRSPIPPSSRANLPSESIDIAPRPCSPAHGRRGMLSPPDTAHT